MLEVPVDIPRSSHEDTSETREGAIHRKQYSNARRNYEEKYVTQCLAEGWVFVPIERTDWGICWVYHVVRRLGNVARATS